jgi:hypothetical protein
MMNTNNLSTITYDFSEIKGEMKLTNFMRWNYGHNKRNR